MGACQQASSNQSFILPFSVGRRSSVCFEQSMYIVPVKQSRVRTTELSRVRNGCDKRVKVCGSSSSSRAICRTRAVFPAPELPVTRMPEAARDGTRCQVQATVAAGGMLGLTCDTGSAEALGSEGIDNVRLDHLEFVFDACEGRIGGGQWSELASART